MLQQYIKYGRGSILPILLFILGIATLPFGAGLSTTWASLALDCGIHLLLVIIGSLFLNWRIKKYPIKVLATAHGTFMAFIAAALLFVVADLFLCTLVFKDKTYLLHIDDTESMRFILWWMCLGWVAHITVLRKHQDDNQREAAFHQEAVISLREAELFKLRQQLQPHFLYNSLNSINALIQLDEEKAQEMVGRLSDFLRLSVKRDVQEYIHLDEELDYIESYLAIESVRFGDRLKVIINKSSEQLHNSKIPPFILQPIIENAIKFGLYGNTGDVTIKIEISIGDKMLQIQIENPYDPTAQTPRGTGFGLEGIARRLNILYARGDLLEIKKKENIFTTIVKIPQ